MKNIIAFLKPTIVVIALMSPMFYVPSSTIANEESKKCKIVCPNSGVDCVHQDADGSTTWSEKGENDAAVITGPCTELGLSN